MNSLEKLETQHGPGSCLVHSGNADIDAGHSWRRRVVVVRLATDTDYWFRSSIQREDLMFNLNGHLA